MKAIKITSKMNGKMQGMISINTTPLHNDFCKTMAASDSICSSCYSTRMMKRYRNADNAFLHNAEILSSGIMPVSQLPRLNANAVRFNAHGEIVNIEHAINVIKICEANPRTTFTLWTKRKDILFKAVRDFGKPKNLILIYSSPQVNKREKLPNYFDKVFTVYDKTYKGKAMINCGEKKCFDCMTCYDLKDRKTYINEVIK
jgi:hypothetical protein